MPDLRRQDTRPSYVPERNGIVVAFLNVRHGRDWTYNLEGFEWLSFHLYGHRLLYQVGRSSVVCQCDEVSGSPIHQERNHMSIWAFEKNHIRQRVQFE